MKIPFASSASGSSGSLAFAVSNLVGSKFQRSSFASSGSDPAFPPTTQFQARLSRLAGNWAQTGTIDARWEDVERDWLISRCQQGRMARLDTQGRCFCGTLADTDSSTCEGGEENDRRPVCVEDLRDLNRNDRANGNAEPTRHKEATCGVEFLAGFEPDACPVGYVRIGQDSEGDKDHYICQDAASPHSCGPQQIDCYAAEGVLRTQCKESSCDPLMCKEGWRFRLVETDGGEAASQCVPAKPLFFNSDTSSRL